MLLLANSLSPPPPVFLLSLLLIHSTQLIYEVRATVEPHKDHAALTVRSRSSLKYTIVNVSKDVGPWELRYEVNFDPKHWSLQDSAVGTRTGPAPGKAIELTLLVIPNDFGVLPVPTLTLSKKLTGEMHVGSGPGQDGNVTVDSNKSYDREEMEYLTLSDAQVANYVLGQVVSCSGSHQI